MVRAFKRSVVADNVDDDVVVSGGGGGGSGGGRFGGGPIIIFPGGEFVFEMREDVDE